MRLAVVTVNYCCSADVLRGVGSTLPAVSGLDGEIWIVDNDSPDQSHAVLDAALSGVEGVHLIKAERNGGFGYGNNQIVRRVLSGEISAQYVYFLNPDAIPEEGSIEAMLNYLDAHPEVGVLGSGLLNDDGSPTNSMFRFPSALSEIEHSMAFRPVSLALAKHQQAMPLLEQAGPVDWVAGTSFMIRADVLRACGGFDEDFFLYWEEIEFCHRLSAQGVTIHGLPSARVRHIGGVSTGMHQTEKRLPAYWHRSRNLYFRKTGFSYLPLLNLATGLGLIARRVVQGVRRRPYSHPHLVRDHFKHAWEDFLRPTLHSHPR